MSTNQQRREAAKRKLERQQARRAQRSQHRKRVAMVVSIVVVVAVVAATVAATVSSASSGPAGGPDAGAPPPPAPAALCSFPASQGQPSARPVSAPSNVNPAKQGTVAVTMRTNQGVLPITLNRAEAPCTVESFVSLTNAGFFNNTPCHRLVNENTLRVLQCGDPTGTGEGGPGYTIPDEPPTGLKPTPGGSSIYPRGTVAMAKGNTPNSGGSQFFLVYADSQLPPDYTIFGTIAEPGIKVLEKIAAAGDDGSLATSAGGGKPKLATTIQSVSLAQG